MFEEEQQGKERADYGEYLIKQIYNQLQPEFGTGVSTWNLHLCRQVYRNFPIVQTVSAQLSWSHYTLLIRIDNPDKRDFYIAETTKNTWSVRELERQINSQLFERLLLSNNVRDVLAVAATRKPLLAKYFNHVTGFLNVF